MAFSFASSGKTTSKLISETPGSTFTAFIRSMKSPALLTKDSAFLAYNCGAKILVSCCNGDSMELFIGLSSKPTLFAFANPLSMGRLEDYFLGIICNFCSWLI